MSSDMSSEVCPYHNSKTQNNNSPQPFITNYTSQFIVSVASLILPHNPLLSYVMSLDSKGCPIMIHDVG